MVEKQQIVELETIVPQLCKVHEVVKEIVDKIVPIETRYEVIKEVPVEIEKIVQITSVSTEVKEVPTIHEKVCEVDRIKEVVNTVNHIERDVQVIDRFEQKEVPIYTTVEKIVEVPYILEKIVERIVVMPQVVEVLKYVHEIYEEECMGVPLTADVQVAELKYREIYGNAKKQLDVLLVELRKLKSSNPGLRATIEIIEKFVVEFDRLASAQRIVTVPKEKVVEKEVERGVLVPVHDVRGELALALLIEKLIIELKRVKKENPNVKFNFDDDISYIFFSELYDNRPGSNISSDFKANLEKYTNEAIVKFTKNGCEWSSDHEFMLHTILGERFAMASTIKFANEEIEKVKAIAELKGHALREKENQLSEANRIIQELAKNLTTIQNNTPSLAGNSSFLKIVGEVNNLIVTKFSLSLSEPIKVLGDFEGSGNDWNRLLSFLRERDAENELLRTKLIEAEKASIGK